MKTTIKLFLALILVCQSLHSLVIESDDLSSLQQHVDQDTWIFIDFDNTLVESTKQIGSAQWRRHIWKKAEAAGLDIEQCNKMVDHFWLFIQPLTEVRLVDSDNKNLIQSWINGTKTFILTKREPLEKKHTEKQFASTGLRFKTEELPLKKSWEIDEPVLYENGIIYCGDNSKGDCLLGFLEAVSAYPKRIIFIDDRKDQVSDVEMAVKKLGIEFIGIRYSKADAKAQNFDAKVADLQWLSLPKLLTDEEALQILETF